MSEIHPIFHKSAAVGAGRRGIPLAEKPIPPPRVVSPNTLHHPHIGQAKHVGRDGWRRNYFFMVRRVFHPSRPYGLSQPMLQHPHRPPRLNPRQHKPCHWRRVLVAVEFLVKQLHRPHRFPRHPHPRLFWRTGDGSRLFPQP